jgi:hypothetical protein
VGVREHSFFYVLISTALNPCKHMVGEFRPFFCPPRLPSNRNRSRIHVLENPKIVIEVGVRCRGEFWGESKPHALIEAIL